MQQLLREHPNEPDAHLYYAAILQNLGLWDKSIPQLRRAADLDPLVSAYRENIGFALHVLGRDEDAAAEYGRVLALDPDFMWALADICPYYAKTGRLREAKKILRERLMPKYPENRATLYCASVAAFRENNRVQLQTISRLAERLYARARRWARPG
jgi:tetratricopeptide (TPR) repeat protein